MLGLLAKIISFPIISIHKIHPILARFCSSSATPNPDPKTPNFSVVDYLVKSCSLSPEKASRISKPISYLKSPEIPDAVLRFLNCQGFADADIIKIVTFLPRLLCSPLEALDTNLRALRGIGLSNAALTQIILSNPAALHLSSAAPRIKYWRDFLGGDEVALAKFFKKNRGIIGHDISRSILPKLSLLSTHGLSTHHVHRILLQVPTFLSNSMGLIEDRLNRTKELGFQPDSKMFVHGLGAMARVSRELLQKKMELLRSFGWSEAEFLCSLRKAPIIVQLSEKNLRTKMDFLMGEVRCEQSIIMSNPTLLSFSLEKRLRPRHHVLRLLESKGISDKRAGFITAMHMSDNKFVVRYIVPHKEVISGLHESYLANRSCEVVELGNYYLGPNANC